MEEKRKFREKKKIVEKGEQKEIAKCIKEIECNKK